MSIHDEISDRIGRGMLHQMFPLLDGQTKKRLLYATLDVYAQIEPRAEHEEDAERWGRLRADLDWFITGEPIGVLMNEFPGTSRGAYLARLVPAEDEVREIRSVKPSPAIRVFGRFADRDVFVAFGWKYEENWVDPTLTNSGGRYETVSGNGMDFFQLIDHCQGVQ